MAKITVDTEQERERLERREGRLLEFPDGLHRIVTMSSRSWMMYDELARRWVYPGLCEEGCFKEAHLYGSPGEPAFEDAISWLFGLAVEAGWSVLNEDTWGHVNQNVPGKST
jgi:hypothetical protein